MEALGSLGINPAALLSQIVNFLILFVALYFLLWKRVMGMFEQRRQRIKNDLDEAEKARSEAAAERQKYEKLLDEARSERQTIIAQATEQAEKTREEILADAREEARQIVAKAGVEAQRQREQTLAGLQDQVADLAILAAGKVIGRSLDEAAHRRLIQEFLAEVEGA